jgi:hypothetical protein
MLSGNMSSTASALVNMTNTTINPSILRIADSADNGFSAGTGVKIALTLILFVGFAIYLMRNTSVQHVLMLNGEQTLKDIKQSTRLKSEKGTSEKTPLLFDEVPPSHRRKNEELELAIINFSTRPTPGEAKFDANGYEAIKPDPDFDLDALELDDPDADDKPAQPLRAFRN